MSGLHDDNNLNKALLEAWSCGFQAAINSVRELAVEFEDEQTKVVIEVIANTLESIKP